MGVITLLELIENNVETLISYWGVKIFVQKKQTYVKVWAKLLYT